MSYDSIDLFDRIEIIASHIFDCCWHIIWIVPLITLSFKIARAFQSSAIFLTVYAV